ncbi:3-oxoacyl-ACP reductase FabG [Rhodococcus fascians]|nr:3-oxoacyl-ACP reductase FabG [Rhodococcus fascians]MBY4140932.1 3-oxoacyl-ACP reductase FabG [Rhodococcus fascians]MBY4219596.1 3-oxoacyl-ACP reductase FabG [Rhodococcus fascians]MBY4221905.1 3-oxoacyl-ACP reductase FabG [Rhodococcus fascians]MBY4233906.1 3-oxoacyl-ACP reductase FabG [Rhodococcus fascians]
MGLEHKVALVTGAGRGVGAEIARALARAGATVIINDLSATRAEETRQSIEEEGGNAICGVADITDRTAVVDMVSRITRDVGSIDLLVNNAGLPVLGLSLTSFVDSKPESWTDVLRININGVLNCCHAVIGGMTEKKWGRIITISSDSGRNGEARMAVYAASKAAGIGFTKSLAKEVGPNGITCNTLALGTIQPPGTASDDVQFDRQRRRYPVGRLGTPGDVAAAVLWLASPDSVWITGQTIPVNGGYATS